MKYEKSKIYRIVCNQTGLCYIGSTTQSLSQRLAIHRCHYKNYLDGKHNYITSFEILKTNDFEICLIEEFPCENKEQLHQRERHYIETMENVNRYIPSRTNKEYIQEHLEERKKYQKDYQQKNREKIREQVRDAMRRFRAKSK